MKGVKREFLSNLRDSLDRHELIQEVEQYFNLLNHSDWMEVWMLFRQDLDAQEEAWVTNSLWDWMIQKYL